MNPRLTRCSCRASWAFCSLFLSLFALAGTSALAAGYPESVPSYTDSLSLGDDASLHAVAFANKSAGLAVGDHGTILKTNDAGASWSKVFSSVQCRLDDVIWINADRAIAVGGAYDKITGISRAVVVTSRDGGQTWRRSSDEALPRLRTIRLRKDGRTLVATGDWSAASLSQEFESSDQGTSWQNGGELDGPVASVAEPTVQELLRWTEAAKVNVPIRDACRVGESGLCAVGDHGVISQSRDGGKTWSTTRGDQRHVAILIFAASSASVPWPLIGSESLEMRNRVSVVLCDNDRPRDTKAATNPVAIESIDLCRQAASMLGAAGVDHLTRRSAKNSRVEKGIEAQSMEAWLSIHLPTAIVIDESLAPAIRKSLIARAMATGVKRIVSYSFGTTGDSMLHSSGMLPATGVLNRDFWLDALQLVSPGQRMPSSVAMRQLYDISGDGKRGESLLSGLTLSVDEKLAAPAKVAPRRQLQIVQGRLAQPTRIAELLRTSRSEADFADGIKVILDQMPKEDQFRLAWHVLQISQRVQHANGNFQVPMLRVIAERFASRSAGKWATLRLQSIEGSAEWMRLRDDLTGGLAMIGAARSSEVSQASEIVAVSPFQPSENRVVQASATSQLLVPQLQPIRRASTKNVETQIDLAWEFHPLVLVARHASRRRGDAEGLQDASEEGAGDLRRMTDDPRTADWTGLVLPSVPQRPSPQVILANRTKTPPRLDGKLDDAFWQVPAMGMAGASRRPQVAYDDDYIYIALQCHSEMFRADDFDRQQSSRIRDHDLRGVDHVELSLDVDQDLMTAMQFASTDSGRTYDAIDEQSQFDPTWYIAAARSHAYVTFEIAIHRRDLTDLPIVPGQSWLLRNRCLRAGATGESVMPDPAEWLRVEFR